MPILSRFYGIVIRMYFQQAEHNPPHIHALYGVYCIIEIPNVANQKRTMLHDHFGYNCRIAS